MLPRQGPKWDQSGTGSFATALKLREETEIVLGKEPDIIDIVTKKRKPLDAHAPGIAGVDFRIDAAIF